MNRILLISGGLLIAIYMLIQFYFANESDVTQFPAIMEVYYTYIVIGVSMMIAGIADRYWLNVVCFFLSLLFLLLNLKFLLMGQLHDEAGVIIRIIGFSISIGGGVSGMINYLQQKKDPHLNRTA